IARSVEVEPTYREFRVALASRLAARGDLAGARGHWDAILKADPNDAAASAERAKVALAQQDLDAATADATAALAGPAPARDRASALAVLGAVDARRGDVESAFARLDEALALEPDLPAALFERATLGGVAGRFDRAAADYRRVTELEPERTAAWLGESTALTLAGHPDRAIARLEVALAERPSAAVAAALAQLLIGVEDPALRDPARAVELAEALLGSDRSAQNADLLIQALAADGRYADAAVLQRQLLDALPDHIDPAIGEGWTRRLQALEAAAGR
ncbi:MAG: tetratricopeptide repeat protein, partial [Acidobacteriota bacterium]